MLRLLRGAGKRGQQEREELQKGPLPAASVVTDQPQRAEPARSCSLQAALKIPSAPLTRVGRDLSPRSAVGVGEQDRPQECAWSRPLPPGGAVASMSISRQDEPPQPQR